MQPPKPPRPVAEPKPKRGAWWAILLAGMLLSVVSVGLTFLTLGYFAFFVLVGGSIFLVIGLQYLIWGWLFERIYRSHIQPDEPAPRDDF